jgi:predicted nucleic acid-binding protein
VNCPYKSEPIENPAALLVPSITITEVFKNVLRQRGKEAALIVTAHMEQGKVVPLNAELARDAARLGILHQLPLADSIIFASAQKYSAVVWTQDSDFEGLAGVKYLRKT